MKHVFLLKSEGTTHSFLPTIHKIMKGYDYDIHISQYPNHVISIMKEYRTPVRVYAVGGDGFMNQVVQALVHTKHEMVVIPYGTGNDFSRYVNNGVKKAEDVLRESLQWHAQRIDTVKMNDLYYINSGCFGIDAAIANHVHDVVNVPFIPESKSYILSILRNIKSYDFNYVTIKSNQQVLYEGQVTLCAINNGHYYGGGFEITPQASLTDGYLDLVILEKIHKFYAPYYIRHILTRTLSNIKKTHTFKVQACDVYCHCSGNFDGEEILSHHYHFEINAGSLSLVCQRVL